jgi:hypothetical protein
MPGAFQLRDPGFKLLSALKKTPGSYERHFHLVSIFFCPLFVRNEQYFFIFDFGISPYFLFFFLPAFFDHVLGEQYRYEGQLEQG